MRSVYTVAIAGISGAGKSIQVQKTADRLQNALTLHFDNYKDDYNLLTKKLKSIQQITQKEFIILEEPTGRRREGMEGLIDLLIFIDIPLEVALARILLRAIYESTDNSIESFYQEIGPQIEVEYREKPTKLMHIICWLLENYLQSHRSEYLENRNYFLQHADFVVDGLLESDKITDEIVNIIKETTKTK